MHKRLINICLMDLVISTEGPLLVKSGLPGLEGRDMAPVVTFRSRPRPEPYIPGSSLKGVLRSHAERIARTLNFDPSVWRIGACDPFGKEFRRRDSSCGEKLQWHKDDAKKARREGREPECDPTPPTIYRVSCPICKIFGNTSLVGRLSVGDAYLQPGSNYNLERRDGVGIDRFTGGSAMHAKFDLEVVTNATFETQLTLTNFELWQLGLLAYVLHDLSEGLVTIGAGKSRGLGHVSGGVRLLEVHLPTHRLPQRETPSLWGLDVLELEEDRRAYGYWPHEREGVSIDGASFVGDPLGLRTIYRLEGEAIGQLWRRVAPLGSRYLEEYEVPGNMRLTADMQEGV